jgi:hypothetical protein
MEIELHLGDDTVHRGLQETTVTRVLEFTSYESIRSVLVLYLTIVETVNTPFSFDFV